MKRFSAYFLAFMGLLLCTVSLHAQTPNISSINRTSGPLGSAVTIQGSNFNPDKTKMLVTFGAMHGQVVSSSEYVMEVRVPAGATFDQVSVTNLVSGKTAFSQDYHLLSFSGQGFEASRFNKTYELNEEEGLFDVCAHRAAGL